MTQPADDQPVAAQHADLDATRSLPADDQASKLANVLDQYLADLQAGHEPDRQKLLADHPDLASQLDGCLSGIEFIHRASASRPVRNRLEQLGDFRIKREVGRGGMGVVYEAEQISLKRRVALKVLRYGAAADSEAMQRFQREAETVAGLHHTNIVPIFAIGCENGVNYYAMQFIEGQSLGTVGESHRDSNSGHGVTGLLSSTTKTADWGLQAAEALAHAHQRGVIHRDIKPSNLILDPDGRIWLTDFGLAKRIDDVSLSMAGVILGTPRYMSPEQAAASKNPIDHRTDIYSLGATLYELATGRPLFEADSPHAVITQILTTEPLAPRMICPNLPRDFETIIIKCLAKEPERRYATAQALADDLRAFVEGRAIKARRSTLVEQAARWFKQQKRSVGIAAAAVAATIVVVVGSLIAWQMHGQSRLGYLTLNTPREGDQRAEVAEVLTLDDQPVGSPFTLPTKEPLALPEGAYRLRLSAPAKVSQTYLFDIAAGAQQTHEVGLVNETLGYAISLQSPVGVEVVQRSPVAERQGYVEPRLFIGPQDSSKPTMRCYSGNSQPGWKPDGTREAEVAPLWEADWSVTSPLVKPLLDDSNNENAWKLLLRWFEPGWFRNGQPPKLVQPLCDVDGDGIDDPIWRGPKAGPQGPPNPLQTSVPLAELVAAGGKDGRPLWWYRAQDRNGSPAQLLGEPLLSLDDPARPKLLAVLRAANAVWIEAFEARTGKSIWKFDVPPASGMIHQSVRGHALLEVAQVRSGIARPFVMAAASRFVMALDVETGMAIWGPHDLGASLLEIPRFGDLDGDGVAEALFTMQSDGSGNRDSAFSVTQGKPLWDVSSSFELGAWHHNESRHLWPLMANLDGDGRPEVILPGIRESGSDVSDGCRVLNGITGEPRWTRRFPRRGGFTHHIPEQFTVGPDLNGDGERELVMVSVRREPQTQVVNQSVRYQREQYFLYVDCFSGRDGKSLWWQRIPFGMSEFSTWTGTPDEPIWWQRDERGWPKLVLPVRRHADQGGDGIGNAGARLLFVLSAETGRVEHFAENLAMPKLVDWNNDGLDDLAVFVPDDPQRFASANYSPDQTSGKFVVLRGSPPEAFRRLDRWVEEQDFDGDGLADLSQRYHGNGDYAIQIASGRDGRIMSKWKTEWPETPRSFTVGDVTSFAPPLGDFDGDGLSDLLVWREAYFWDLDRRPLVETGKAPLLTQAISSKTAQRIWGGVPIPLPDWMRPNNSDENSDSWKQVRNSRLTPITTQVADLDADGRPEVLQVLLLSGDRPSQTQQGAVENWYQPYLALIDGRAGTLRWSEPLAEMVVRSNWGSHGNERLRIDASTDLNGDGTRDLTVMTPQQDAQGSWSQTLQAQNGRDGKRLWGPKPLEGKSSNDNDFNSLIVSDLDGDGRTEIVLMEAKQPHVTVLRGDTGESLWTWQGSQPQYFASPGIAVVASRLGLRPDPDRTVGTESQPTKRCVAVTFNETGSQWNLVLLDHTGKELEKVPYQTNQLWSQDLDGDGDEELVRLVDNKVTASRGLHDVLWSWSAPPFGYGHVSHFERTPDGRMTVFVSSGDSVTLLDGKTGKPLGRTFKSTNTSLNENGRYVDLNRPKLNSAGEAQRLLTRVGDGPVMLGHVVSRTVLPTDQDGRYQRSRHAPRDEAKASANSSAVDARSTSHARSAHHAERGGYVEDPRLVRQLPWAPSAAEWSSFWTIALLQFTRALVLSLVTVLIPFWLIRASVRRRELGWWRGVLIVSGVVLIVLSIATMRSLASSPGMRGIPWGAQLMMAFGALPILAWPTTAMRCVFHGEWRRLRWLLGGTLIFSIAEMLLALWMESATMSPEQHYSWHGWWLILLLGAYGVGSLLVLWRVFGPGMLWVCMLVRRKFVTT